MADTASEREEILRREYLSQTARIPWRHLQTHYAQGAVIAVRSTCDLVEVAVQLGLDNTAAFQRWIDSGEVHSVSDDQALTWFDTNAELWAVVSAPWVLVQDRR